jgi:hypothetical protein
MSFVSCEWIPYLGGLWYKLVDTDFVEDGIDTSETGWGTIIQVYERRNLNVPFNLMKAVSWFCSGASLKISWQILCCKREPEFAKYEQEVQKYLMLLSTTLA